MNESILKYYDIKKDEDSGGWEWFFNNPLNGGVQCRACVTFDTQLECEKEALDHWSRVRDFVRTALK